MDDLINTLSKISYYDYIEACERVYNNTRFPLIKDTLDFNNCFITSHFKKIIERNNKNNVY